VWEERDTGEGGRWDRAARQYRAARRDRFYDEPPPAFDFHPRQLDAASTLSSTAGREAVAVSRPTGLAERTNRQ
jgi:hypothetical protein